MKKILALILVFTMTALIFSACTGGDKPQLLAFISGNDEGIDLMGDTFVIMQETDYMSSIFDLAFGTQMYDAIKDRFHSIEQKYNCVIEVQNGGGDDPYVERVRSSIAVGDVIADILYGMGANKMSFFASAGYLYPLTELKDYLDYENSEKFGTAGLLESAMWNGIPYAVQPVQWIGFPNSSCYFIVYNPRLFAKFGLTDLHEFYETKSWTWENYENLFEQFNNGGDNELYLLSANKGRHAFMSLYSNGVIFCKYDENGVAKCDINSPESIKAIDWSIGLFNDHSDKIYRADIWDTSSFIDEKSLMAFASTTETTLGGVQYSSNIEFSIMPFPSGPDGVYGRWANWIEGMRGFGIPVNNERPEIAARIINDLCEPMTEVTGGDLREYYNNYVFFDPLDTQILLEVGQYTRAYYYRNLQGMRDFMNALDSDKQFTAAEVVSQHFTAVSTFVEHEMMPNYVNYIYDHLYAEDEKE